MLSCYPQRHKNFEIFTKYELKGIKCQLKCIWSHIYETLEKTAKKNETKAASLRVN